MRALERDSSADAVAECQRESKVAVPRRRGSGSLIGEPVGIGLARRDGLRVSVSNFVSVSLRARLCAGAAFVALTTVSLAAQAPDVARIPIHVVNGRLVVACQIAAQKRIAANLFVDYDAPCGLVLHTQAARGIEVQNEKGSLNAITVYLPDINIEVGEHERGVDKQYDEFTKWWSKELGENAVVGTLGAKVLANYHATFDLAAGFLELSAPHAAVSEAPEPRAGSFTVPITIFGDKAWVKVGFGDKQSGALALATSTFDTWIDGGVCRKLGKPAGDVGPVRLADVDLANFVAFRPDDEKSEHPDGAFGRTGLNLLASFRVEIDRVNHFARFTATRPASFPIADAEYFKTCVDGTPEALEHWLERFPSERFSHEAALALLDLLVNSNADEERSKRALALVEKTTPEDLQATSALSLMDALTASNKTSLVLAAGALGLDGGRKDRYPDAVHKIHARMGDVLLASGDRHEAWKHLLSAAFGLPEDGPLNLSLARYYEDEGRYTRAFSRYLQALLSPDSGSLAIEGLIRVQAKLPEPEAFSVDAIERLVEGKIQSFGTAARFEPTEGRTYNRAVLSELYTNAHAEGEIGVLLARDGLRDFFPPERLVLVTYHVPDPDLDPLVNPLSHFMWEKYAHSAENAQRFDQRIEGPSQGLVRHKEKIFEDTKKLVTTRLARESEHTLVVTAEVTHAGIHGRVVVNGAAAEDDLVQILLVERGVLFPGKSKVLIHRNVARAALTPALEGLAFAPVQGAMQIDFDRSWGSIERENTDFLEHEEAQGGSPVPRFPVHIDPRQARIVAILRTRETGSVLQAAQFDPVLPEDMK